MAIKFKYDGIEFEVSTPREAAQVVRELRRLNRTFSVGLSLQEAMQEGMKQAQEATIVLRNRLEHERKASLEEAVKARQAALDELIRANAGSRVVADAVADARLEMTHDFLIALQRSPRMSTDEAIKVLKTNHPKGLGPRSMLINNMLRELGFAPNEVYDNSERTADGARIWVAKSKLSDAIAAVERVRKQQESLLLT